ncbi:UNVERIFIED_CONTAM: hypothetical protein NCL1_38403 [Trichonephila clavipes]
MDYLKNKFKNSFVIHFYIVFVTFFFLYKVRGSEIFSQLPQIIKFIFALNLAFLVIKIKMKAYFSIMVVLCVVLLSLQAVEMSESARARRQSDNDNLVELEIPQDILARLVEGLLGALGLEGGLGGLLG